MGEVVEFRCARALAEQRDAEAVAGELIAALGVQAGYKVGYLARYAGLSPDASARLLRVADEIERQQGFGWFADDPIGGCAVDNR